MGPSIFLLSSDRRRGCTTPESSKIGSSFHPLILCITEAALQASLAEQQKYLKEVKARGE